MQMRKCDLKASVEQLIEALYDIDVVISCVGPAEQQDQIPLAKAAKRVGVKRFIPCGFITVAPPGGVMWLRDEVRIESRGVLMVPAELTMFVLGRKRLCTTRSARCGFPTPSSMSAGGTSCLTLVLALVASTTP